MDRLEVTFVALLVLSLALGGFTTLDRGNYYSAIDASDRVSSQISVAVTDAELREETFVVTARLENPSSTDVRITGARMRVFNRTNRRIASGAGDRLDDGGSTLPADGSQTVTYSIRVSDSQHDVLERVLELDAGVSLTVAMRLGDAEFVVRTRAPIGEEVR